MNKNTFKIIWLIIVSMLTGAMIMTIVFRHVGSRAVKFDGDYDRWAKLNLILQQVQENYVDDIDKKAVTDAAAEAALAALDPHSIYLPPVELETTEQELHGNFEGIGIQFNVPNDTAIVLSVISGGPSERAGLLVGDRLLKVGERKIAGNKTPQDSMVTMMKGPSGTKVTVTVLRGDTEIPFEITRGRIPINSLDAAFMIDERTGYIRFSKFSMTTYKEFRSAFAHLLSMHMEKLILDIRDNSGGYLDQALKISNEFLEKGSLIVYMEGKHRPRQEFRADGKGMMTHVELSVLIDENSASSSEILAGAIQDNDRGVVVGRRSFGKGLVQEPVYFTDGSGIRITVARFYTPSGRCIQKPYSDDYDYEIYERYMTGELTSVDSIKIDRSVTYYTCAGREVYGGGGIIPDVFVPMDTTLASNFCIACNKKAIQMRFASWFFDRYGRAYGEISDFAALKAKLSQMNVEQKFLEFAASCGIKPAKGEWEDSRDYMMPQINGLVGRYSKVGEEAFYRYYLDIDPTLKKALEMSSNPIEL